MMTNMVRIGEESGQLAAVMEQIAPYYKEKMETLVIKVTKMLEPVIIMGMGTHDRRPDAGDLHADVRDGRQGELSFSRSPEVDVDPRRSREGHHATAATRTRRGYTLLELMIVVTIMGVLIAMPAPMFGRAIEQPKLDVAASNLRSIWAAERFYYLEKGQLREPRRPRGRHARRRTSSTRRSSRDRVL